MASSLAKETSESAGSKYSYLAIINDLRRLHTLTAIEDLATNFFPLFCCHLLLESPVCWYNGIAIDDGSGED